jgi:hypothetical protein
MCYSLDRESSNEINRICCKLGPTNMRMHNESKSWISSKQHINPVLFAAGVAVATMAILRQSICIQDLRKDKNRKGQKLVQFRMSRI